MKRTIGTAEMQNGLYLLDLLDLNATPKSSHAAESQIITCPSISSSSSLLWHYRLGHASFPRMKSIHYSDSDVNISDQSYHCEICPLAKMQKLPFQSSTTTTKCCFELIHVDIWGPYKTPTVYNQKYFLTIVDDFSRFTWIFLMQFKSEASYKLQTFCSFVENQFSVRVKTIRSDNGPEFFMKDFFASNGIVHQTSCVETP